MSKRGTRVVLNSAEITLDTRDPAGNDTAFVLTTGDKLYLGFRGKFASRHFQMATANTNSTTLSVKYWDGTAYSDVLDLVDGTNGFQKSGFVSWGNDDDWQKSTQAPVSDVEHYWVEITVSADLSVGTSLRSVLNLFSDDDLLRVYYPELVTDTRYLPSSRTNFLEQHLAAKEQVVWRLRQRRAIEDEDQIIDVTEYSVAAVHKCAEIILNPIEPEGDIIERAREAYNNEVNELVRSIDQDRDGKVDDAERNSQVFGISLERR